MVPQHPGDVEVLDEADPVPVGNRPRGLVNPVKTLAGGPVLIPRQSIFRLLPVPRPALLSGQRPLEMPLPPLPVDEGAGIGGDQTVGAGGQRLDSHVYPDDPTGLAFAGGIGELA